MKNLKLFGTVFSFVLLCISCASNSTIRAVASPGQTLSYENNFQLLLSNKSLYQIKMSPVKEIIEPYSPVEFALSIFNNTNENLNFSTDNIKAYCGNHNLKVYSFEEALIDYENKNEHSLVGLTPEQINSIHKTRIRTGYYENKNQRYNEYLKTLLKRQTIRPKNIYGGIFKIASPNPICEEPIVIEVGDFREKHKFIFKLEQ